MTSTLKATAALSFFVTAGAAAAAPDADAIVERYVAAIGGRAAIAALDNLVYSGGVYEEGDYSSPGDATMSLGRPWFKLVGDKTGGYAEGYDGSAWEWFADPGVVLRTVGPASAAIRHYAGVEHPLVDYQAKGSTVGLVGATEFDGRPVTVIELVRRDGFAEQFFIDDDTGLIVASGATAPLHAFGAAVRKRTRIGDYRPVAGVRIPHRFETIELPSGRQLSSMQWGEVRANVDLPDDWFSPPTFDHTPLQRFIEDLYRQRADAAAMLWTYHEFRRANPGADTQAAVGFAGFHGLKMGAVDTAVTLLEQNVVDYPDSADARFGLGRAYRSAGRSDAARELFASALRLDPDHERAADALTGMAK